MERYAHNKMFTVMTNKRKRKRKKLVHGLDADDEEEAALLLRIEREEQEDMEKQGDRFNDETIAKEIFEELGFPGEEEKQEEQKWEQ